MHYLGDAPLLPFDMPFVSHVPGSPVREVSEVTDLQCVDNLDKLHTSFL